jgi:hypothetical protein
MLIHSTGVKGADEIPDVRLVRLSSELIKTAQTNASPGPPPAATQTKPVASTTPSPANAAAQTATGDADANTASANKTPPDPTGPAPVQPAADSQSKAKQLSHLTPGERELRTLFEEAWSARNDLVGISAAHDQSAAWTPIDQAPHLWRNLDALLIDRERRFRCRRQDDTLLNEMKGDVRNLVGLREALLSGKEANQAHDDYNSVVSRIIDVVHRRHGAQPIPDQLVAPLKALHQALLAIPYYLDYRARTGYRSLVSSSDATGLMESVERLQVTLTSLNGQVLDTARQAQLNRDSEAVLNAHRTLQDSLQSQIKTLLARPLTPLSRRQIDVLLSTPLPATADRMALLDKIMVSAGGNGSSTIGDVNVPPSLDLDAETWRSIDEQVRLESEWLALSQRLGRSPETKPLAIGSTIMDWDRLRNAAQQLRDQYQMLAQAHFESADDSIYRLFFVDGRDATALAPRATPIEFWKVELPDQVYLIASRTNADLDKANWTEVQVDVQANRPSRESVQLTARFRQADLQVEYRTEGGEFRPVAAGSTRIKVPFHDRQGQQTFRVRAVREDKSSSEISSALEIVADAESSNSVKMICRLPKPNQVDLIAELDNASNEEEHVDHFQQAGSLRLKPYPNRPAACKFYLVNRSGREKNLNIQLLALPDTSSQRRWPVGKVLDTGERPFAPIVEQTFRSDGATPLPSIKVVAKASLKLPADDQRLEISFGAPAAAPAAKEPADPAADKTKPAEPPAAGPPPADVSYGLACLIENADDPTERWVKWIEIRPKHPSQYVRPEIAVSKQQDLSGELDLSVGLKPKANAPMPINLMCRIPIANLEQSGRFSGIDQANPLKMLVPEDYKYVEIDLDIDGFPRAFMLRQELVQQVPFSESQRAAGFVRINRLQLGEIDTGPIERESEQRFGSIRDPDSRRYAFRLDEPGKTMTIALKVDGLWRASNTSQALNYVVVSLKDESGSSSLREEIFGDRRVSTTLALVPEIGLRLAAAVHDQSVTIQPPPNVRGSLVAELFLDGRPVASHEVPIVFDGRAPIIRTWSVPQPRVDKGKPIRITWSSDDLSGLQKAEFALLQKRIDPFPEKTPFVDDEFENRQGRDVYDLPTADLEFKPTDEQIRYWVRARFTDQVGHTFEPTEPIPVIVRNVLPPPVAGSPAGQKPDVRGTVRGTVKLAAGYLPDGIKIKLEETGFEATTNRGKFEIPNVPAGKYKIQAAGSAKGKQRKGEKTVEFQKAEDYPATFDKIIVIIQ